MRTFWGMVLAIVLAGLAAPLHAQEPEPTRPRLEELRRRVRERVAQRIQQDLNLTPDQMQRLRATVGTYAGRRRDLEARQRALREALGGQLRPGLAATPDSVARLTDELLDVRVRYAESFRDEQRELSRYLDPVQRAKIMLLRERLTNRVREFRRRRLFMER
jgi:Spy/CpxP family protein refolding chaperone